MSSPPVSNPELVVADEEIFAALEGGKLSLELKAPLDTQRALSIAYTPGVAQVCRAIAADNSLAARYTWAHRLVAVVSDGSAVLGLGDIGATASLPVMEGKSSRPHRSQPAGPEGRVRGSRRRRQRLILRR